MKKLFYVLFAASLFACSSPEEPEMNENKVPETPEVTEDTQDDEYCTVSLNLKLENVDIDISQEPLTKAVEVDSNDLLLVNIYEQSQTEGYHQSAYGTFNHLENLKLTLKKGNIYHFKVTFVKNAKQYLRWLNDSTYYWNASNTSAKVLNRVVWNSWNDANYSATEYRIYLSTYNEAFSMPILDRYYGQNMNYSPTENGSINIDLRRIIVGIKFNITGLTTGKLNISINGAPEITIHSDSVYSPDNIYQMELRYDWNREDLQAGAVIEDKRSVYIDWVNDAGNREVRIYSSSVPLIRLQRTTVNVSLNLLDPVFWDNTAGVTLEDAEIVEGESVDISGEVQLEVGE